jgi:hypothetical protein
MNSERWKQKRPRLLSLAYGASVPREKLAAMERLGRSLGLPLSILEAIGQDERSCDGFVRAVQAGALAPFLRQLTTGRVSMQARPVHSVEVNS